MLMSRKYYRFCSLLPGIQEVITIVYEKSEEEEVDEEYEKTPQERARFEHPAYRGLPIWSSWMDRDRRERELSEEEAAALRAQVPANYLQTSLSWLRGQISRIEQERQRTLAEVAQQEAALELLLSQSEQQTYGEQTPYIRQVVGQTVRGQRSKLTEKLARNNQTLRDCNKLRTLLASMRSYDIRVSVEGMPERIVAVIAEDEQTARRMAKGRVPEQFYKGDFTILTSSPIE